jgi:virulence factor Mce-like protein
MDKGAPSVTRIVTMVLFALSCFGLILFLWLSFGGPVPFRAKGYQIHMSFPNAQQLAGQADVRIAGVPVGKVISKELDNGTASCPPSDRAQNLCKNRTIATIEMQRKFAPVHEDAMAILRVKTILGETYIDLSPGSPSAPPIPDGGTLLRTHVGHAVQLDEIFNALDPNTRQSFQIWQQEVAKAVQGNDQNLNNALGNLPPFVADATDITRVLDVEHASVVRLVQNGGTVFGALGNDQAALRNLITTSATVFATTAANNTALFDTFQVFPTFLNETKATMAKLKTFSLNTDSACCVPGQNAGLLKELRPVAQDLAPTLADVRTLSPALRNLFVHLGPLIDASKKGLPAVASVLHGARPLLGQLGPFLEQLNPILTWLSLHQQLVSDFITNGGSALAQKTLSLSGGTGHTLPQYVTIGPETLALQPTRDPGNRGNVYPPPTWLAGPGYFLHDILPSWDCLNTGAGGDGSVPPDTTPLTGHPGCTVAQPLGPLVGQTGKFPQILAAKYPAK